MSTTTEPPLVAREGAANPVLITGDGWSREVDWWDETRLATPAFWVGQAKRHGTYDTLQIGMTLAEELALCMLGGYGITEQAALTAFYRLREEGLLDGLLLDEQLIHQALSRPFQTAEGRSFRYRFPALKAQRVTAALTQLRDEPPATDLNAIELRDWLTRLPGVGLKTASWVVRNLLASDDIAVIDAHIRRAGMVAGVFDPQWRLPRDYLKFEQAFVAWAQLGGVPTAQLDAYIWSCLAALGPAARSLFHVESLGSLDQ